MLLSRGLVDSPSRHGQSSLGSVRSMGSALRFQTTSRAALEAPYLAENQYHDQAEMRARIRDTMERNKVSQLPTGLNAMGSQHPCRTKTAQGTRLASLRAHKELPAFDTESRLQQRDIEKTDHAALVKFSDANSKSIKKSASATTIRVSHDADGAGSRLDAWNKRQDFAVAPETNPELLLGRMQRKLDSGALWNRECESQYLTESQIIQRKKKGVGVTDKGLVDAIKLNAVSSHWSLGHDAGHHGPEGMAMRRGGRNEGMCARHDHVGIVLPDSPEKISEKRRLQRSGSHVILGNPDIEAAAARAGVSPSRAAPGPGPVVSSDPLKEKLYNTVRWQAARTSINTF